MNTYTIDTPSMMVKRNQESRKKSEQEQIARICLGSLMTVSAVYGVWSFVSIAISLL